MLGSIEGVLLKKWGKEGKERARDSGEKIFLEVITVCKSRMQCFLGSPTYSNYLECFVLKLRG